MGRLALLSASLSLTPLNRDHPTDVFCPSPRPYRMRGGGAVAKLLDTPLAFAVFVMDRRFSNSLSPTVSLARLRMGEATGTEPTARWGTGQPFRRVPSYAGPRLLLSAISIRCRQESWKG